MMGGAAGCMGFGGVCKLEGRKRAADRCTALGSWCSYDTLSQCLSLKAALRAVIKGDDIAERSSTLAFVSLSMSQDL